MLIIRCLMAHESRPPALVEALRRRIVRKPDRDHRSLFELDDRLIELMGLVEDASDAGTEISAELAVEIDTYLEAYRLKVDHIVGYWRWQQSVADISGREAERLAARKKAGENRVTRLKGFLFAFMMARGIKKLEGEKSDIGMQRNSMASLVVDDPLQVTEHFFERQVRFNKTELQEVVYQLTGGELRRRLEQALKRSRPAPRRAEVGACCAEPLFARSCDAPFFGHARNRGCPQ